MARLCTQALLADAISTFADPESFVRVGPILTTFFFDEEKGNQIQL